MAERRTADEKPRELAGLEPAPLLRAIEALTYDRLRGRRRLDQAFQDLHPPRRTGDFAGARTIEYVQISSLSAVSKTAASFGRSPKARSAPCIHAQWGEKGHRA